MKNTTPDAAVLQELNELTSRIFQICEQNNMPVVIGYSYESGRNEDGCSINKSVSAYADKRKGVWDSTIAAASIMLRLKEVPDEALRVMANMAAVCGFARAIESSEEKSLH
ncbi:hypothetical protein H0K13_000505 [Salmonella enterica]|uniref:hypothetical protein n=1 Tax=Salmonella enterica TaxID=28901 RepID=UPI000BE24177|nr:hypothetical protein [Salmonella enterica]ATI89545.1 hypothetical protein CGA23_05305 [Salmonella enterica subsp. enterica]ECH8185348.1 hypothetical protein [Salmonella enterica subsp. enterica serovar Rissen]EEJ6875242.1 hypothetical protein [Salmonella enterica subsp. houtenae]EGC9572369.1 hypothetical protein [Salmonella enterica subsp. enterica serovar Montevideo]EGF6409276.1 hypothetical protein [Salmonella enterica subsp. enterica serovar 6,8:d:-]EHF3500060.1 hypothetical protein [Sa